MAKKLTLSIDDELVAFAHAYSQENGLSISKLVEDYLKRLRVSEDTEILNSKTRALYGLFEGAPIPDKKQLREAFHEKSSN